MAKAHCMGQYIKMSTFSLNFNNLKPLNVWSFDVTLNPKTSYFSKDLIKKVTSAITGIELPTLTISKETKNYGSYDLVLPIYETGERTLVINFDETDDMAVSYFLSTLIGNKPYSNSKGTTTDITIIVKAYRPEDNSTIFIRTFECSLKEFFEPQFNRNGNVAETSIKSTFLVQTAAEK